MTLTDALGEIGKNIITDAKKTLKKQGHIATGNLYNTMNYVVNKNELSFDLSLYAKYVDQGRRPGKGIPVDSLKKWLKIKGLDENLSFIINKKIREKGIKPSNFFTNAFDSHVENIDDVLDKYVDEYVEDQLNDIL